MSAKKILIIEDQPENIGVLFNLLEQYHYELLVATDGESGLEVATEKKPDIILLDVLMPGLNGFETCCLLKQRSGLQDIPVIFMTALSELENKVMGFEVGAVDYVTKPFQQQELLMRIFTHLRMRDLNQELIQKNHELDAFAHTVAHDLKNPLHTILQSIYAIERAYEAGNAKEFYEFITMARQAAAKTSDIIEALLMLAGTSRHTQLFICSFDMAKIVVKAVERLEIMIKEYDGKLTMPERWPFVVGYPAWVEEVWFNYLSNALKYGGTPPKIELGLDESEMMVRFWVRDNGPGLSAEEQEKLFIPFTRLHTHRAEGHGLGLSIVQNIISKLDGQVGVESTPGHGSIFYFTLPRYRVSEKTDEYECDNLSLFSS